MTERQRERDIERRRGAAGFTLVELMVVIAIIAALATIVGVNVLSSMDDADVSAAQAQIRNLKTALTSYKITYKRFPSSSEGLNALIQNDKGKKFLDSASIPTDPWGNPYLYSSEGNEFKIVSYGADGSPGGSGYDADISSDDLGANND
jgi:general secretion pathway protein G